ncbi:MAG: RNA-directed DNA polymerase [Actinomycetota bacterium]
MRRPTPPRSRWRDDPIRFEVVATSGGVARTIVHLSDRDRRGYDAAVSAVTPAVERALGDGVVANRARSTPIGVVLEPWGAARRRYARSIASAAAGPWRAAFIGDVRDCYGSIGPPIVERALRNLGAPEQPIEHIVGILRRLEERGVRGLPVGPHPSAVLANAALVSVDRDLGEATSGPAFRWVDDVVVLAMDRPGARHAAATFTRALDTLGLTSHPAKCRIVDDLQSMLTTSCRPSVAGGPAVP